MDKKELIEAICSITPTYSQLENGWISGVINFDHNGFQSWKKEILENRTIWDLQKTYDFLKPKQNGDTI